MDIALLKKMHVYPTDAAPVGLMPDAGSSESTLIKADISLFHDMPASEVSAQGETSEISDYDVGFQEGHAKADLVYQDTIKVMQMALDNLQNEMASMARQIERSHLSAVAICLRAVFPRLMRGGTDLELKSLLQDACGSSLKGQIQLRVHPDDKAHCEQLCTEQDIVITADKSLSPLKMSLQWIGGGADIDCQAVAAHCLDQIDAASHQPGEY